MRSGVQARASDKAALALISEQEKLTGGKAREQKGLLEIINSGFKRITGFIIDSQRKKESIERIDNKLDNCMKKLETIYESTGNPILRRAVLDSIEKIKEIYSLHVLEIETMYSSNEKIENKLVFYKVMESDAIEDMDDVVSQLKKMLVNPEKR
ncbi:MAG: hypothetical protein QXS93_03895 [Candidatus Micrarchaeia archaeon]